MLSLGWATISVYGSVAISSCWCSLTRVILVLGYLVVITDGFSIFLIFENRYEIKNNFLLTRKEWVENHFGVELSFYNDFCFCSLPPLGPFKVFTKDSVKFLPTECG
jgi:hypothetical protein